MKIEIKKNIQINNKLVLTEKQKKIALYVGISLLVIIVLILALVLSNFNKKKVTEQERLTNYLENKATNFYQNDYYSQVSEITEDMPTFLANFQEEGISMSINVLIDNGVITEEEAKKNMKNKDNDTKCDYDNTKAVIYPEEPYKKDSYKVRIQLDCGLETNEKDK